MWRLFVVLVTGGAACKAGSGAAGFLTDGDVTDLLADRSLSSDACPLLETGVDPASGDGGNVSGGQQCGGSGSAVVASTHGSFELHSVFVVVYTCAGSGFTIQFADDSTPRRSVELYLPLSPSDSAALLGTHSIGGLIVFGDSNVSGLGTLEVTSSTNPYLPRVAFPAGLIEGRFSFEADGCATASGTFSTPYCQEACVQN